MICGYFHKGSGLGDQLMRYVTVRTLAEEKEFGWGMVDTCNFKGKDFMQIKNFSGETPPTDVFKYWNEKDIRDASGVDIRSYDPEINFVEDNTILDGGFEDFKYWGHNLTKIDEWLHVEPMAFPDDTCVIGFRGGEFYTDPDLGLPSEYWEVAIGLMRVRGISKFEVHTDDPNKAMVMLSPILASAGIIDTEFIQDIGINWRSMRFAKYAIIANSAFYIMPRMLKHNVENFYSEPAFNNDSLTLAPRYWARRNTKTWARPACYYEQFTYL